MKHKKNILVIITIFFILTALCSCGTKDNTIKNVPKAENDLNISILKVGQADAIILKTKNHTVVIDCGEEDDGDEICEHLSESGCEKVDFLFITHFDKDHVGGASEVINSFEVSEIITPDYVGTSDEYRTYASTLQEKNITPTRLTKEMLFTLDDVFFEVYPPQRNYYAEGDNDYSLVISITHGENKFLFAGDAEKDRLQELSKQLDLEHTFLKMPHHGKFNKGTVAFLKNVSPAYTVICDSEKNPAEDDTLSALKTIGSEVYHTKDGDISVLSDGETILVVQ